jgi:hypothetical protein
MTTDKQVSSKDPLAWDTAGLIFEFKDLDQARAFAAAAKKKFKMDARVFDDAEEAMSVHHNPFVQTAPVVHVDRPSWFVPAADDKKAWDEARKTEAKITRLAVKFGGEFFGT